MMKIFLSSSNKIEGVSDRLGQTDANIKGVYNWLPQVFTESFITQVRQIYTVETVLVPVVKLSPLVLIPNANKIDRV